MEKIKSNQLGDEQLFRKDIHVDLDRTYKFIWSIEEVKRFADEVLYPLEEDEVYITALMTRNKYVNEEHPEVSMSEKEKNRMFEKSLIGSSHYASVVKGIAHFTAHFGAYYDRKGQPMPENGFVIYIKPNPRSTETGFRMLTKEGMQMLHDSMVNKENLFKFKKLDKTFLNILQGKECKSKRRYIDLDFDFDSKEEAMTIISDDFMSMFNKEGTHLIETRGGYHLLLDLKKANKEALRQYMPTVNAVNTRHKNSGNEIEVKRDDFCPLPGTIQGGFNVRLIW